MKKSPGKNEFSVGDGGTGSLSETLDASVASTSPEDTFICFAYSRFFVSILTAVSGSLACTTINRTPIRFRRAAAIARPGARVTLDIEILADTSESTDSFGNVTEISDRTYTLPPRVTLALLVVARYTSLSPSALLKCDNQVPFGGTGTWRLRKTLYHPFVGVTRNRVVNVEIF